MVPEKADNKKKGFAAGYSKPAAEPFCCLILSMKIIHGDNSQR